MRRASLILVLLWAGALPSFAQDVREEVLDGAARCAGIADDRTWLECFYGAAQPMRSRLSLPPAPPAQTRLVPPPGAAYVASTSTVRRAAPVARGQGLLADLLGSTSPTVSEMPMTSYNFDRSGRFTIRLQNGQVYVQEESDLRRARWRGPASELLVTLQSIGDRFDLKLKSEPGVIYRVRRR